MKWGVLVEKQVSSHAQIARGRPELFTTLMDILVFVLAIERGRSEFSLLYLDIFRTYLEISVELRSTCAQWSCACNREFWLEILLPRTGNFSVLEFTHTNGQKCVRLELFPTRTRISREIGLLQQSDEWLAKDKVGSYPFLSSSSIYFPFLLS